MVFVLVNGASMVLLRFPLLTGFTPIVWIVLMWCRPVGDLRSPIMPHGSVLLHIRRHVCG